MGSGTPPCANGSSDGLIVAYRWLTVIVGIGLVLAIIRSTSDPDLPLLRDGERGSWVTVDREIELGAQFESVTTWQFRRQFPVDTLQSNVILQLRAFRSAKVWLDERLLFATPDPPRRWKNASSVSLPELIPGDHLLLVEVTNQNGPAALRIDSPTGELSTDTRWQVSLDDGASWGLSRLARNTKWPKISYAFVKNPAAFLQSAPWLLPIFVIAFLVTYRLQASPFSTDTNARTFEAHHLRTILFVLTFILFAHNFGALQHIGYDLLGHVDYIKFIVERGEVPLASDGWQMFQSPLFYLICAPIYWLVGDQLELERILWILRVVPLICGLVQIELVYRTVSIAFPGQRGLQCIGLAVGAMMPMSILISQAVGNEPLAGCLTSWALLRFVRLLASPQVKSRDVAILGVIWGLALLTKVTPVLLGPALAIGLCVRSLQTNSSYRRAMTHVAVLMAAAFAMCGWYYVRNWILMGRPFVGGWDSSRGIVWWQEPGYRMVSHFTGFGAALIQPIYSGVHGLWDGLYSTMYADGFLSGIRDVQYRPGWNYPFLVGGTWWGLLPSLLILAGLVRAFVRPQQLPMKQPGILVMAAACVITFLAAVLFMYLRIPLYGASKATYLLGLLPCFGLLAASGAEPLLKSRVGSAVLSGLLACWCSGTLIAFYA